MDQFYQFLDENGMLKVISGKKAVFREPRNSNKLDKILMDYSKAATGNGGKIYYNQKCILKFKYFFILKDRKRVHFF